MSQTQLRVEAKSLPEHGIPTVEWGAFLADWDWRQGEHVTIAAPTGWGKTHLGLALLPYRKYVVVFANKPKDDTMQALTKQGFKVVTEWKPVPEVHPRVILWPPVKRLNGYLGQKVTFQEALTRIYEQGSWCVYFDELDYICNVLKLSPLVELLWRQGRSLGVSVVGGTQRPAFIPLLAYDQASHLFIGRDNDEVNARRYASIAGGGKARVRQVMAVIQSLPKHHFLYISSRTENMVITKVSASP
jgi:hypothetical protein